MTIDRPNLDTRLPYGKHRMSIAILALLGAGIAGYLSLYQIDVLGNVWDPFFGSGSEQVLTSLEQLPAPAGPPVPDMLLVSVGYLLVAVLATAGTPDQWRTSPWVVAMLGLVIYLLALVHLLLVLLEPVLFHAWSTACLVLAAISLATVALIVPELVATVRQAGYASDASRTRWEVFWGIEP